MMFFGSDDVGVVVRKSQFSAKVAKISGADPWISTQETL